MGNTFSRDRENVSPAAENVEAGPSDGVEPVKAQKRSRENDEHDVEIEMLLHTPKKKRLKTTSR